MCDPEVEPRELQNHLLQIKHFTTEAGLWIPQYLHHEGVISERILLGQQGGEGTDEHA